MATVSGVALLLTLIFRVTAEPIVNSVWTTRSGGGYVALIVGFALFSLIFGLVSIGNLVTSPAQDLRALRWAQSRKPAGTSRFNETLIEPSHPDWDVPTYRYLIRRLIRSLR